MTEKALENQLKKRIKAKVSTTIEQRGRQLLKRGAIGISETNWSSQEIYFFAKGTHRYSVFFKIDVETLDLSLSCNCPYEGFCKHQVGVLFFLINDENIFKVFHKKVSRLLSDSDAVKELGVLKNSEKLSNKVVKKSQEHYSSEPYLLENANELSLNSLIKYDDTISIRRNQRCRMSAIEVKKLKYQAHVLLYDYTPIVGEEYEVELSFKGNDLEITCDCNHKVTHICGHAYIVLNFLLRSDPSFFTQEGIAQREQKAEERAKELGLPYKKSWREVMQWRFEEGSQVLEPLGKYKGAINVEELDEDPLGLLYDDPLEMEWPEEETQELRQCGFCLIFPNYEVIEFEPLSGNAKSAKAPFANRIKPYSNLGASFNVEETEADVVLQRIKKDLEHAGFGSRHEEIERVFVRQLQVLQQYGDLLAQHPRIYLYQGGGSWNRNFRQKDITQVQFHPHTPSLRIQFKEENKFVFSQYTICLNDQEYELNSDAVSAPHYLFVRVHNHLFLHSSLRDANLFEMLFQQANLSCSAKNFPTMVQKVWAGMARQYAIDWSGLKSFAIDEQKLMPVQKEIYLKEIGDFILFKPVAQYQNNRRINVLSRGEEVEAEDEKITVLKRDSQWEQQFEEELRVLHPDFAQQHRPDFFHLKGRQFLKDNWFLKVFPRLQQMDIAVYGWKDLKNLKVNPHPAKVSYQVNHETDWFETQVKVAFGDENVSLSHLKKNLTTDGYVRLKDGTMGLLPEEWVQKLERLFETGAVKYNKVKVSDKLFNLVDELFNDIDDDRAALFIQEKKQKLQEFDKIQPQPLPKGVKATLRHYQEDGYNWLCFLHEFQWGGILADDMGLGKTLQVITFLSHVLQESTQTNLVVVPTSLLFNWENELAKFAPKLKAHFYHGKDRLKELKEFDQYDIVFTSYGLMIGDIEKLREYTFNYIVLDESQAIKNAASKRYKAARLLQGHNRLALTGTPIENHTFDLFAQLSFVNPGLLGSAAGFKKNYAQPIDKNGDEDKAAQLQRMIRPFILRRTKEQVAQELPDKVEDVLYCEMPAEQRKVYDAYRNKYRDLLLNKIDEEGIDKSRFSVLEGLTKLRQICDTPELLNGEEQYSGVSAKVEELLQHIREKTGQHKILVFSQFVKMLRIIEEKIKVAGIPYEYLDGKSSTQQRQKSVSHFQEDNDCRVFLISLKAGGTGLNLMAADYVYLVDPWWNPAVENQAIDRCYRIGQDKKVIAYRMISKNSVEEKIMALQSKKKALASDLIQTDEHVLKQLDKQAIQHLFE